MPRRKILSLIRRRNTECATNVEKVGLEAVLVGERTTTLAGAAVKKNRNLPVSSVGKAKQVKKSRLSAWSKTEEKRSGY
jgi:hypothetical protein